ncbi:12868_t:CDS:10 [Funneliformis mosseae]|uniref:12868_t:CDS:1 n=1 Tax=Funneliformis mosseae TaxID=27381 RepID=A0A9N9DRK1_FUNMO|nr:12868_t:CDS:10 [Funneliformis mosseae]
MTEHHKKRKATSEFNKTSVKDKSPNIERSQQVCSDKKKLYTVSVALPGSIIDNAQSIELKTYLAGQLARSFAVFNVDEIIIFNELGIRKSSESSTTKIESHIKNKRGEGISLDPNIFLARILQYLETPQYLRKELFPVHQDLTYAGLLNPLDCPHHVRKEEKSPFREGVIIDKKPRNGKGSLVNAGLSKYVIIDKSIKTGIRVTLDMGNYEVSKKDHQYIEAKVVSPKLPKQHGLYWGYHIRIADSISKVFTECSFPGGYDITIGTSERGKAVDDVIDELPEFSHLLVVFGGLTGSRTIRTEEAVLITMSSLRAAINKKGRKEN